MEPTENNNNNGTASTPMEFVASCVAFEIARSAACRMVLRFLYAEDYPNYAVFRSYVIKGTELPLGTSLSTIMTADPSCCKVVLDEVGRIARMVASRSGTGGMRTLWRPVRKRLWMLLRRSARISYGPQMDGDSPEETDESNSSGSSGQTAQQEDDEGVRQIVELFSMNMSYVKGIAMAAVEAVQRDCLAKLYQPASVDPEGGVLSTPSHGSAAAKPVQDALGAVADFFGVTVPVAVYDATRAVQRRWWFGRKPTSDAEDAAQSRAARLLARISEFDMQDAYAMACIQITNQLRSISDPLSTAVFLRGVVQRAMLTDFGFWHALAPSFTQPAPSSCGSCMRVGPISVVLLPRTHFECMIAVVRRVHEVLMQLLPIVLAPSELELGPYPSEASVDKDPYDVWDATPSELTEERETLNLLLLTALGGKAADVAGQAIALALTGSNNNRGKNAESSDDTSQLNLELPPGLAAVFESMTPVLERVVSANAKRLLAVYDASAPIQYKLWRSGDHGTASVETGRQAFLQMSMHQNDQAAGTGISFSSSGTPLDQLATDYEGSLLVMPPDELSGGRGNSTSAAMDLDRMDPEMAVSSSSSSSSSSSLQYHLGPEDRVRDAWRARWGTGAGYLAEQFSEIRRKIDARIQMEMATSDVPREALLTDRIAVWIRPPESKADGYGITRPEWKLALTTCTIDLDGWSPKQIGREDEEVQQSSRCLASLIAIALSAFATGVDVVTNTEIACNDVPWTVERTMQMSKPATDQHAERIDHAATLHGFGASLARRRTTGDALPNYRLDWHYQMRDGTDAVDAMTRYPELASEFVFTSEDAARVAVAALA